MNWLRRWAISLWEKTVAELRAELAETKQSLRTERYEHEHTLAARDHNHMLLSRESEILGAVLNGIEFEPSEGWRETPAAAMHAAGAHLDAKLSAERRRADDAEEIIEKLKNELRAKDRDFEVAKNNHAQAIARAELAELERDKLADVCERDRARVLAEKAAHVRRKVEALAGVDALKEDDHP